MLKQQYTSINLNTAGIHRSSQRRGIKTTGKEEKRKGGKGKIILCKYSTHHDITTFTVSCLAHLLCEKFLFHIYPNSKNLKQLKEIKKME